MLSAPAPPLMTLSPSPVHAVGAGAAVDDVVAFVAVDDVVELVAGRTARAELSLTAQWLKPGLAQE